MNDTVDVSQNVVEAVGVAEERQMATKRIWDECVAMVMRQTDYDEETTSAMLKKYKGNYDAVIRDYLTGTPLLPEKSDDEDKTVNQRVFSQIRSYMDGAAADYSRKKEAMEHREQLRQHQLRQHQLRQQQLRQQELQQSRQPPAIEECDDD